MERLTFDGNFCDIAQCWELPCPHNGACSQRKVWERLKAYEDTGLTPEEIKSMKDEHFSGLEMAKLHSALVELKKYQEADRDGRLVVLPCKVGDTVYRLFVGNPDNPVIATLKINTVTEAVKLIGKMGMHKYIGTFLTREEAEAALEAMKDE
jgi:hypothetical protein